MSQQTPQNRVLFPHALTRVMAGGFVAFMLLVTVLAGLINFYRGDHEVSAATNSTLNFQARLENSAGNIVPDGFYNVQFKLYDGGTAGGPAGKGQANAGTGSTHLWAETWYDSNGGTAGNDNRIQVRNGYLTANLGSQTAFPSINWNEELWITMNIGGTTQTATPTWDGEMNPRLKLTGVPYSFNAGQLATANAAGTLTSTLSILQPTVGNQTFQIQDQGAAGTYNLCIQNSTACGFAAATGATGYIQNQSGSQQTSSAFWISGTGRADTALQAPSFDTPTGVALNIGTTNATSIVLGKAGVNTRVAANLSVGTTQSFGAITVANDAWFSAVDSAGTGSVNMFKVNTSNQIQVGAALNIDGGIVLPTNGGQMTLVDLGIDSTASSGAKQSYTFRVGSSNALTVYGEADGSGNAQNIRVAVGSGISPQYTLDVSGIINATTEYRINGTQGASVTCTGGNVLSNQVVQGGIVTGGSCVAGGGASSLQGAYNGSTDPEIVVDNTRGGLTIKDNATPITLNSGRLLEVLNNSNVVLLGVTTAGASVTGTLSVTTVVQAPLFDTESAAVLNIGTTNATGINLNKNVTVAAGQYISLVGDITANRPASPTAGMLFYDQTTAQLLTYNGTKWQADRDSNTKIVAASNSSQAAKDAADYVADGTSDETEINAALTAAAGGRVYLVDGTYTAAATILVPNNTTLMGAGIGSEIQLADLDATDNLIENSDTATGGGITIRDLKINGRSSLNTAGTQHGIYLNGMGASTGRLGGKIENVQVHNFRNSGIYLTASDANIITGNFVRGNGEHGIYVTASTYVTVSNNIAEVNSSTGITLNSTQYSNVAGNNLLTNSLYGIHLSSSSYTVVSSNMVYDTTLTGIYASNGAQNSIISNTVSISSAYGIQLSSTSFNNVSSNSVRGNSTAGIYFTSASNNNVAGNKLHTNGGTTTNESILLSSSDSNNITGNSISDTSATTNNYAINISNAGSDTNYLADNTLGGGSVNDLGTGTIYAGQVDGTGNLIMNTNSATSGTIIKSGVNSQSAFQLANSYGQALIAADTTNTTNLMINPGFDVASTQGITNSAVGVSFSRITTKSNIHSGIGGLEITTAPSGTTGINLGGTTFGGSKAAGTYTFSFYSKSAAPITGLAVSFSGGGTCTLNSTTISTSGFVRYYCTVTTVGSTGTITITAATNSQTFYIDSIQLQTGSTLTNYDIGTVQIQGTVGSPLLLQNAANSLAAFEIQNATGTSLLTADTINNQVIVSGLKVTATLQAHSIDTASAVALNIGSAVATVINLNQNTTVAAGKTITMVGDITANRPASPTAGMLFFDQTTAQLLTYNGSKWQADRDSNTKIVAASNSSQAAKDAADYITDGNTGAVADGDQVQINQALTAAAGGRVYLLEGTYVADETILIPNNTTLMGAGNGTLIELADLDATDNLIENTDTATGAGVVIRDLKLDGRKDLNTAGTQYGIHLNGMGAGAGSSARQGAEIRSVTAVRFRDYGINLNASSNNLVTQNMVLSNGTSGINAPASSSYNVISDNNLQDNATGISIASTSSNNTIIGNVSQNNTITGINISSSYNIVSGNSVQNNTSYGIFMIGGSYNTVDANFVRGSSLTGIHSEATSHNTIADNKVYDNGGATANNGIILVEAHYHSITGNTINDSSATSTNYAISILDDLVDSDYTYLANNTINTGTIINNSPTTKYSNQLDSSGNSINQNSGALVARLQSGSSANLFQAQDSSGNALFTVSSTGQLTLGRASGANGSMVFANSTNANAVTINTGVTSASYALTLPTAGSTGANCLKSTSGSTATNTSLEFGACGVGSASTLQDAYDASGTTDPMILLNDTNDGVTIVDASTPITGSLFSVQNFALTASYLGVTASAVTLQDSAGNNGLIFDSTTSRLKVYENIASPVRFADIYYDSVNNEAVYAASSGNTRIGSGSGHVTINLTNQADLFTYTKSATLSSAYSSDDMTVRRNITAGANALTGSVLRVESISTGSSTVASNILWLNENNTSATGNLILATKGGSANDKFKVDTTGNVTLGGSNASGSVLLSSGSGVALNITSATAATWQTTAGNLTLQATSADNRLVFNTSNNRLEIGESDTTGTLLVLDTKTNTSDPTGVDGAMYYNSGLGKFRCYEAGAWKNCIGPDAASGTRYFREMTNFATIINTSQSDLTTQELAAGTTSSITPQNISIANRPGIVQWATGTTATGRVNMVSQLNTLALGAGKSVYEAAVNLTALSSGTQRYQLLVGFFDSNTTINMTDGAYLLYDEGGVSTGSAASGNWQLVTSSNSTRTFSTSSSTVAAATWYKIRVEVNAAGTSVEYFVNDTSIGTITTNIPTGTTRALGHGTYFQKSVGTTASTLLLDYVEFAQDFTTAR